MPALAGILKSTRAAIHARGLASGLRIVRID